MSRVSRETPLDEIAMRLPKGIANLLADWRFDVSRPNTAGELANVSNRALLSQDGIGPDTIRRLRMIVGEPEITAVVDRIIEKLTRAPEMVDISEFLRIRSGDDF